MANATHQLSPPEVGYVDKRRSHLQDVESRVVEGGDFFFCNAAGTTTTAVGANAAPGTNDNNVVRRGERFKLFTSAGALKEEKVFEVTAIAVGASTTVTFTPAAATATVNGDRLRRVRGNSQDSISAMDDRLIALGFSQARIDSMTTNDKQYQIRVSDDPGSL